MSETASADPHLISAARARAKDLLHFIDASPTPYHAVFTAAARLQAAGYTRLEERQTWQLERGAKHYVIRSGSSLIAFVVGEQSPAEAGFLMMGAHTDSPNLKLKPRAAFEHKGYRQLGVEIYGGVLLHTWLDRDLSVAGRVTLASHRATESVLIDFRRPIARVPNLAIHLNRTVNADGLKINPQTQMPPVLGLVIDAPKTDDGLSELLAHELGVAKDRILDHDLSLYDVQPGALGGLHGELIFSPRLDNLASCHLTLGALLEPQAASAATKVVALYDHEEVGSRSVQGAAGPFLEAVLGRIAEAHPEQQPQALQRALAGSFFVSADMAHAIHPNYADKHEPLHAPMLGLGPVVKTNANQSYATDGESAARFIAACRGANVPHQSFVTRTDLACGSTIGPITAGRLGVATVDVGNPMLSMHSVREMAGVLDTELMHRALARLFSGE